MHAIWAIWRNLCLLRRDLPEWSDLGLTSMYQGAIPKHHSNKASNRHRIHDLLKFHWWKLHWNRNLITGNKKRLKWSSSFWHIDWNSLHPSFMFTFCHFKIDTLAWRWIKRFSNAVAKMNHNKQTSLVNQNPNQTFSDFLCRCLCSFLLSSFFLLCFSFLGLKWDKWDPASLVNVAYGISSLSGCASASRRFLAWQALWNHRPGGSIWRSLADLKFAFDRVWNLQQDTKYVLAGNSTLPTKTRDVKNIRNMMPIYQQVDSLMPLLLSPPSLWPLSLLFPWPL